MYTFLTQNGKIKIGLILLIMSLLLIIPISSVNSARPKQEPGSNDGNDSVEIELDSISNLSHDGMAYDDQILAMGTGCDQVDILSTLSDFKEETDMSWIEPGMTWYYYQLPADTSVEEVEGIVKEINQESQQQEIDCQASPNYLTYLSGHSIWGSPHTGAGVKTSPQAILTQPALPMVKPSSAERGAGVTVAMFDTYCDNSSQHLQQNGFGSITLQGDYQTQAIPVSREEPVNLCGHGEAVASLLRSIAPESDIKLYRVLGDDGFGTLDGLIMALADFAQKEPSANRIINLSLGVKASTDDEVPILQKLLLALYKRDILIVAAAGKER